MKEYIDTLKKLDAPIRKELTVDLILGSLPDSYDQFIMKYNMHGMDKTLTELYGMLKNAEQSIKKSIPVLMVRKDKGKGGKWKGKAKSKPKEKVGPYSKGKEAKKPKPKPQKEDICFHCNEAGHWKRNCPLYLEELKKRDKPSTLGIYMIEVNLSIFISWVLDTGCGSHICSNVQRLRNRRRLTEGEVDLKVGNRARVAAIEIGHYPLTLPSRLILNLINYYYVPAMGRNIISVSCLDNDSYNFIIKNNVISIFCNDILYGNAILSNGLYILDIKNHKSIYNIDTKRVKLNESNHSYF
ncbi:RNA-directed DNA polymerase protein [Dioscorea alata]|uniref:RNA-directed DNA polymerase protein n=1 Tax=Dioscorea alata TaxID=55571 RepID=A0ACB7WTX2_DIOAL|nr:RNA-directed DNA polymerase protein [Dioscorea alata]